MKGKIIILTAVIINIIAIIFNFDITTFYTDGNVTVANLAVSVLYLMAWIILSGYTYMKKDIIFSKFMLIYWSISAILSVLTIKITGVLLLPLYIIYFTPFDGVRAFMKINITTNLFMQSIISIIFVIVATCINKHSK